MPMETAMVMEITPMVAAVPKAVPVRKETRQFKRKAISTSSDGRISSAAQQTMAGMVPAVRHRAVSSPIRRNSSRIFFTVRTPESAIFSREGSV